MRHRVLVLDVSYQTIDIVPWQRAVTLQMHLKVDVVAYYEGPWVLTADQAYYVPAVVRTRSYSRHAGHKTPLCRCIGGIFSFGMGSSANTAARRIISPSITSFPRRRVDRGRGKISPPRARSATTKRETNH